MFSNVNIRKLVLYLMIMLDLFMVIDNQCFSVYVFGALLDLIVVFYFITF